MILLDTHVALWLAVDPGRLGQHCSRRIRAEPAVFFSSLLGVEVAIKKMAGRLDVPDTIADQLVADGLEELPFTARHAVGIYAFPELVGHDPFDRALLAQASAEGAAFLTADRRLLGLGRDWVIDARD